MEPAHKRDAMSWESMSGHFGDQEIAFIQSAPVEKLIQIMLASDPVVALRVFRELAMHEDLDRALDLADDSSIREHLAEYVYDAEVNPADGVYYNAYLKLVELLLADEQSN